MKKGRVFLMAEKKLKIKTLRTLQKSPLWLEYQVKMREYQFAENIFDYSRYFWLTSLFF